eukprot:snap_masked-scaffold_10-processed-gene-9.18-mRNA-1 protein AED:0.07 eAED:0.07 QI:0/-1/0/1/-1/1/1/0/766
MKRTTRSFVISVFLGFSVTVGLNILLKTQRGSKLFSTDDLLVYNETLAEDSRNVLSYKYVDALVVLVLKYFIMFSAILGYLSGQINGKRKWLLNTFYWSSFSLCILLIAKLVLFEYEDALTGSILVTQILVSSIEQFYFAALYQPFLLLEEEEKKKDDLFQSKSSTSPNILTDTEFLKLLKPYFLPDGGLNKLRCILTFIFLGGSRGVKLLAPIYIGLAVDEVSSSTFSSYPDLYDVFKFVGIYCLLNISSSYLDEMHKVAYLRVGQVAYTQIAKKTFEHLHTLSLDWHVKKKMGSVLRSMDRGVGAADTVVRVVFLRFLPTIGELLAVFVIFYTRFQVRLLSAVLLLSVTCYGVLTFQITMWRKKFRRRTNRHDNDFHDRATDSIINYETVKYFSNEEYETKRYVSSIAEFQQNSTYTKASLSFLNALQQTIIQGTILLGLFVAAASIIIDGTLSVGDFVSVQIYLLNVFTPLSFLGLMYNSVVQAFIDVKNLSQLLAERPDIIDHPDAIPLSIPSDKKNPGLSVSFQDVSFSYPSNKDSGVRNIDFTIPAGKSLALVGSTGSGKTTISRLLFRFYEPDQGKVLIADQDLQFLTQKSVRSVIGVVPQDTVLFNETIRYNVAYGKVDATDEEIEEACRSAMIYDFIQNLPEGFQTKVGERGLRLSGGEKQRISIARCLLKNPPIVLLDEATSALDSHTETKVQEALNHLSQSRTTITIAHRLSTVKGADNILVLEKGRRIEEGNHLQLLERKGRYASLWNTQLRSS